MSGENHSSRDGRGYRDNPSSRGHREDPRDRDRDRDRDQGRRRRSRSPDPRSSGRRGYEGDSYSSSRDYRAREREEKYRDRRDDRDPGRRPPAPVPHRPRDRPDRELFDDRRGGGGGGAARGRNDRDGGGGRRERPRSPTPPSQRKKKEPTPDLTDVIPVLERRRRMTQWDIKPAGYENVTSEQAKLSGMFPLPGAPRQQPMDPSRLQAFMNQPSGSATNTALKTANARQSKRLFVSNIPAATSSEDMNDFINGQLNGMNAVSGVDPCISAKVSKDGDFGILEFKTPEDATIVMALNGITMRDDGEGLVIRRPRDYIVPTVYRNDDDEDQAPTLGQPFPDSPEKISVTNLPTSLEESQIQELLAAFGDLKYYFLVKDISRGDEQSQGIAFCEYADPERTELAIQELNGMKLADNEIQVQRASSGSTQAVGMDQSVGAMSMLAGTTSSEVERGRVIQLLNMVTPEELMKDDEYEDIYEDVKEECEKYGTVLNIKVPRPGASGQTEGVGKIYVKFETTDMALSALQSLAGRKFADRTVVVTFFGEEYFDLDSW